MYIISLVVLLYIFISQQQRRIVKSINKVTLNLSGLKARSQPPMHSLETDSEIKIYIQPYFNVNKFTMLTIKYDTVN